MQTVDEQYLTVAEAATLLRVAPSTVRRWIRQGDIPAYRLGPRRVGLKREDLSAVIAPVGTHSEQVHFEADIDRIKNHKLTPEEKRQGLEAMERLQRTVREISARHGGPFPSSLEIIHEMRDERDRQLMEALRGGAP